MELLVNDLSVHGQFPSLASFREAVNRVMTIRQVARRFGRQLYCHRNLASTQVTAATSMPQALTVFSVDERRALMVWLSQQGPFWEDTRGHGPDDYLECNGDVVTDTALGEAAFWCFKGLERRLVSLIPSSWQFSPLPVIWYPDSGNGGNVEVINHWEPDGVEAALQAAPVPLTSWRQLEDTSRERCTQLPFLDGCFEPLRGHPFANGAAQRILVLLDTLNRLMTCRDARGHRTPEGQEIYQNHFTGQKAWFTDSSDTEKRDFRSELTFAVPGGAARLCGWHGKVKTPQLRVHFNWPVDGDEALHIVYVGPKITKR